MLKTWLLTIVLVGLLVTGSVTNAEESETPALRPDLIPNEVVVGFHDAIPESFDSFVADMGGEELMRNEVLKWVSFRVGDAAAADVAIERALERSDVRYAGRDGIATTQFLPPHTPNDQNYGLQWGFPAIQAPAAWGFNRGNILARVSILDTGVEVTHPDLAAQACGPFHSFVPGEPTIMDGHGHGTHVAGTVAATSDNIVGVAGTSQSCLMGAKVLSSGGGGQWTWVASGITWSVDNGAHVISMSLGGGNPGTPIVEDAVNYAVANDVLVIAAAGNSYCFSPDTVIYPARYPGAMAVGSLAAPGDVRSGFSSCGPAVEISAPGSNILSTWRGNSYNSISGTSMATPHVSGVAALIKSAWPWVTAENIRCVLTATADDIGPAGWDYHFGHGRVNAYRAVTLETQPQPTPPFFPDTTLVEACGIDWPF
jgi:subtilisin family serine protease